jgi:hypothetical protein
MAWTKLIRFESEGRILYGKPEIENGRNLQECIESAKLYATVYEGASLHALSTEPGELIRVEKILPLLQPEDVPIIKCVGLNYVAHSS